MNIISAKDAPAVHKSARGEPSQAHKVKSTVYVRTCVALLYGWAVGTEVCTTASVWGTCVHMLLGGEGAEVHTSEMQEVVSLCRLP